MSPTTVKILLYDGEALGIRTAELGNHIIKAVVVPRARWEAAKGMEDLKNVGVYFLLSNPREDGMFETYVGKTENIGNRITDHTKDDSKDFWNHLVCFVAKDASLNIAQAEVLESVTCKLAKSCGRSDIKNAVKPSVSNLSDHDSVDTSDFLEAIKVLLATLGFPILQPRLQQKEELEYSCVGKHTAAKGFYTNEGFLVKKDSLARCDWTAHVSDKDKNFVRQLAEDGVLEQVSPSQYKFKRDYLFSSPSRAAFTVLGASANGWTAWKNIATGKTLSENVRD